MQNSAHRIMVLLIVGWLATPTALADAEIASKIVQFCKDNVGKQVGRGECSDVAVQALKEAGAKPQTAFADSPNKDDYVWGELVYLYGKNAVGKDDREGALKDVQPGDIIQLRDAMFAGKAANGGTYTQQSPHHTSVVAEVKDKAKQVVVYEQNSNNVRVVMKNVYRLNDLRQGWIRIYRPVAK